MKTIPYIFMAMWLLSKALGMEVEGRKDTKAMSTMQPDFQRDIVFMHACMYGQFVTSQKKDFVAFLINNGSDTYLEHVDSISDLYKSICVDARKDVRLPFVSFRRYLLNSDLKEIWLAIKHNCQPACFFSQNTAGDYHLLFTEEMKKIFNVCTVYRKFCDVGSMLKLIGIIKRNRLLLHLYLQRGNLEKIVESSKRLRQPDLFIAGIMDNEISRVKEPTIDVRTHAREKKKKHKFLYLQHARKSRVLGTNK